MTILLPVDQTHWLDQLEKRLAPSGQSVEQVLATDEESIDFWEDSEWWDGEPLVQETRDVAEQAEETFEASTPGSSGAFQAAEQATIKRWYADQDNGRIQDSALDSIGGGHQLRADAADSFRAMRRAAKKDGVALTVTDSYRTYDQQVALAQQKGLYSQGGLAAEPGTSEHGWGLAVDLDPAAEPWLRKHAKKFGFHTIPREPWHWEYHADGSFVPKRNAGGAPRRSTVNPKDRTLTPEDVAEQSLPLNQSLSGVFLSLFDQPTVIRRRGKTQPEIDTSGLGALKAAPAKLRPFFKEAAEKSGLPIGLLISVARVESNFNPKAVSSAGAQGVMQIMPLHNLKDPFNPRRNIIFGAKLLASYISGLGLKNGVAAYNAGPGNYQAGLNYASTVLDLWRNK